MGRGGERDGDAADRQGGDHSLTDVGHGLDLGRANPAELAPPTVAPPAAYAIVPCCDS
jgi:hypothetical protein